MYLKNYNSFFSKPVPWKIVFGNTHDNKNFPIVTTSGHKGGKNFPARRIITSETLWQVLAQISAA
jgi:hypothetical protein